MKRMFREMNEAFAGVILAVFYIVGVGATAFFLKLSESIRPAKKKDSYWNDFRDTAPAKEYFKSPY